MGTVAKAKHPRPCRRELSAVLERLLRVYENLKSLNVWQARARPEDTYPDVPRGAIWGC